MKLDYNYFLQRRNLTTKKIIDTNSIKTYESFVRLMYDLKVIPPPEEEINSFFMCEKPQHETSNKHEKDNKQETRVSSKKASTRRTKTGNTSSKNRNTKSAVKKTSSIRKKKSV